MRFIMNNLMACYAYGRGTEIDYEAMARLEDQFIQNWIKMDKNTKVGCVP